MANSDFVKNTGIKPLPKFPMNTPSHSQPSPPGSQASDQPTKLPIWRRFTWRGRKASGQSETTANAPTPLEDETPYSFPIQLMTRDQKMRYWIHGY